MSVAATRGRIFDKNGVLLAYNDLAYAVRISDSGKYEDNDTKNRLLNSSIDKTLTIIEEKETAILTIFLLFIQMECMNTTLKIMNC